MLKNAGIDIISAEMVISTDHVLLFVYQKLFNSILNLAH